MGNGKLVRRNLDYKGNAHAVRCYLDPRQLGFAVLERSDVQGGARRSLS
jgi:hypothetical protein